MWPLNLILQCIYVLEAGQTVIRKSFEWDVFQFTELLVFKENRTSNLLHQLI